MYRSPMDRNHVDTVCTDHWTHEQIPMDTNVALVVLWVLVGVTF